MSGIFNASIFNNTIFNTGDGGAVVVEVVKIGTGGIDPEDRRRRIYKPTGLLARSKKNIPTVEARTKEVRDIHAEVVARLAKQFEDIDLSFKPIEAMTSAEVDREIALLMHEKLKSEEEETMLVLMMALNE